ncbi:hypothetical protein [Nocardiopsis flavescens]
MRPEPASVDEALLLLREEREGARGPHRGAGTRTTGWEWPIAQPTLEEVIASLEMVYDLAEGTTEGAEEILRLVRALRALHTGPCSVPSSVVDHLPSIHR